MFKIFRDDLLVPFMSLRWAAGFISLLAVLLSFYFIFTKGINYGVDFAGGVQLVLQFNDSSKANEDAIRKAFKDIGLNDASVQSFGADLGIGEQKKKPEYIVHFSSEFVEENAVKEKIAAALSQFKVGDQPVLSDFRFSGMEKAYFSTTQKLDNKKVAEDIQKMDFGLLKLIDVSPFGNLESHEYELRFENVSKQIEQKLAESFGEGTVSIQKLDFVGAKVGSDLKTAALLSILVTILLIFVYVFLRFDLAYAPGVVIALAHDVIITVGVFSLLGIEFDLTVVAALLTVAGYSINDTIIVYDRIREAAVEYRGKSFRDILDLAISQTLNRTVITSGTTMIATVVLFSIGGPVIHSFAMALSVGIFVGTYSSIFIAAALVLLVDDWMKKREQRAKKQAA